MSRWGAALSAGGAVAALASAPRLAAAEATNEPSAGEPVESALEQTSEAAPRSDLELASSQAEAFAEPDAGAPSLVVPALHGTGLFITLRLTEAYLYPDPFAETRWSVLSNRYQRAFTRPPKFDANRPAFEWDGDPWHINVVGHALLGSELYLRARTCGHGPLESLAFTAAGAVVWDYAFEGNGVRPSAFDLVYTPAAGILLGELRHWVWSSSRSIQTPFVRGLVRGLFDPLGEVERWAGTPC